MERFLRRSHRQTMAIGQPMHRGDLHQYLIEPSENLTKFEAIYIPDIREDHRSSDTKVVKKKGSLLRSSLDNSQRRKSKKYVQATKRRVKIYEEEDMKELDYIS